METPVQPGQKVQLEITSYGHEGEGVGRYQNFTLFIPGALKGEAVEAKVTEVKKNFARGSLLRIIEEIPERRIPACPVYHECGGCQLQHLSYPAQLALKRQQVMDAVERIGGLTGVTVHPTLGMKEPRCYRNKVQYPLAMENGKVSAGFYRKGTHQIVPVTGCLLHSELSNRIVAAVVQKIEENHVPIYNERTGSGLLRHVLIKNAFATGEMMVVLVTNGEKFPSGSKIATELMTEFPAIRSVVQNINRSRGNVILGNQSVVLGGSDAIQDILGGLKFKISARSFFQVNPVQTEVLYEKAVDYAGLAGTETVLDAYCGVGSLTLFLARRARAVYGIEVVPEAIRDARENAALNEMKNVQFLVGETERVLPELARQGIHFDVATVDPPRAGCEPEVLRSLAENGVGRIVYVSCNPSTLARDLKLLGELGYKTMEIQPVDMFPQTYHVETVVLMSRKDK